MERRKTGWPGRRGFVLVYQVMAIGTIALLVALYQLDSLQGSARHSSRAIQRLRARSLAGSARSLPVGALPAVWTDGRVTLETMTENPAGPAAVRARWRAGKHSLEITVPETPEP